jgi:hypothetical protein
MFDAWHQETCSQLQTRYAQYNHELFIGQAQKWVNMTLKYVYTFGEQRISGFAPFYQYSHVPLDTILIDKLQRYHAPQLTKRWSRLDTYTEYLAFQHWIRQRFTLAPLDVEFRFWLGKPLKE